jgi:hypothetical protein
VTGVAKERRRGTSLHTSVTAFVYDRAVIRRGERAGFLSDICWFNPETVLEVIDEFLLRAASTV